MFTIYDIKTEYLTNPLGMDEAKPRFSYKLKGDCEKQAERRIIIKTADGIKKTLRIYIKSGACFDRILTYDGIF